MEHFYEILWTCVGTLLTGICTWLAVVITNWLNKKMKDKQAAKILSDITILIMSVIQETYQIYVQSLKDQGKFDAEAQSKAKDAAVAKIKSMLTVEQRDFIASITGDVEAWISTKIESAIYQLKNK